MVAGFVFCRETIAEDLPKDITSVVIEKNVGTWKTVLKVKELSTKNFYNVDEKVRGGRKLIGSSVYRNPNRHIGLYLSDVKEGYFIAYLDIDAVAINLTNHKKIKFSLLPEWDPLHYGNNVELPELGDYKITFKVKELLIPGREKPKVTEIEFNFSLKTEDLRIEEWNFNKETVGKLPKGFSNQVTGRGNLGRWEIIEDKTAPGSPYVLAQTSSENFGYQFNLAVIEDADYSGLELEVKFKAISGEEDQGGGPIWRYQDPDNYYIARANPLENNFRVYKVVNGKRRQLASSNLKVTSREWHTIKIINKEGKIQCYYDKKLYLEVKDNTFKKGKIGLWTKADAVTSFDDIKVKEILP